MKLGGNASDSDRLVRLSPASIRLYAERTNHMPLGTIEKGVLVANRPDDFLVVSSEQPVDYVFFVPRNAVLSGGSAPAKNAKPEEGEPVKFKRGVFVEAKRMARVDLSNQVVARGLEGTATGVLRKPKLELAPKSGTPVTPTETPATGGGEAAPAPAGSDPQPQASGGSQPRPAGGSSPAAGGAPAGEEPPPEMGSGGGGGGGSVGLGQVLPPDKAPFIYRNFAAQPGLLSAVAVGAVSGADGDVKFASGTGKLKDRKFVELDVRPDVSLTELAQGENALGEVWVPEGSALVQLSGEAPSTEYDPWLWAKNLDKIVLSDSKGKKHTPHGAWARVNKDGKERMIARYDANKPVASIKPEDGAVPVTVVVVFVVPRGVGLTKLDYRGERVYDFMETSVP
jgi:hypothetical protein